MGLTLIVDGEVDSSADEDAITSGFGSIEPTTGWRKSISIVELYRDKSHGLTVSGHPVEGWYYLSQIQGDMEVVSNPRPPLPQDKVIEIFRAYLRGDDLWMSEFQWERQSEPPLRNIVRNIVVMLGIFALLVLLLRWFKIL